MNGLKMCCRCPRPRVWEKTVFLRRAINAKQVEMIESLEF